MVEKGLKLAEVSVSLQTGMGENTAGKSVFDSAFEQHFSPAAKNLSKIVIPVRSYEAKTESLKKLDSEAASPLVPINNFEVSHEKPVTNWPPMPALEDDAWGSIEEQPIFTVSNLATNFPLAAKKSSPIAKNEPEENSWISSSTQALNLTRSDLSEDPWNIREIDEEKPSRSHQFESEEKSGSAWPGYNPSMNTKSSVPLSQSQPKQESRIKIPENHYTARNPEEYQLPEEESRRGKGGRGPRGNRGRFRNFRGTPESSLTVVNAPMPSPVVQEVKITPPAENWPNFSNQPAEALVPEEFNLKTHKTQKCPVGEKCRGCNKYHYEGEKRRELEKIQYTPMICARAGSCMQQDRCGKAHNFMEIYYHPQIYRSHPCPYTIKLKQCVMGTYCNFIHLFAEKSAEIKNKVKCGCCQTGDICMARVKCGHACCKNCAAGPECKKCSVSGDVIKIEL